MSRIEYQTENWGGEGEAHLEIRWQGVTMHLNITDDKIEIIGALGLAVKHRAVNAIEITPDASGETWRPAKG